MRLWNYWLGCGLAVCCLWSNAARAADTDSLLVEAIDVEGGAATLYITPEHQSLLIDTGWTANFGATHPDSAERIIAAARRHGLSKLDYVLITHYHHDHVGGLPELLSQFLVGTVLDHGPNREVASPDVPPAMAPFQTAVLYSKQYLEALGGHNHRTLQSPATPSTSGRYTWWQSRVDAVTIDHPLAWRG